MSGISCTSILHQNIARYEQYLNPLSEHCKVWAVLQPSFSCLLWALLPSSLGTLSGISCTSTLPQDTARYELYSNPPSEHYKLWAVLQSFLRSLSGISCTSNLPQNTARYGLYFNPPSELCVVWAVLQSSLKTGMSNIIELFPHSLTPSLSGPSHLQDGPQLQLILTC